MQMIGVVLEHQSGVGRGLGSRSAPHPKLAEQTEVHVQHITAAESIEEMLSDGVDARDGLAVEDLGAGCEPTLW